MLDIREVVYSTILLIWKCSSSIKLSWFLLRSSNFSSFKHLQVTLNCILIWCTIWHYSFKALASL